MQIPIIQGVFTDQDPDFRTFYPINLRPIPKQQGISSGYLKTADGLVELVTATQGVDRGAIEWNGELYRVLGSKLVKIESNGTIIELGEVGNNNKQVTFTYSFDRLAVASNEDLFYWNGTTLTQVTDPDLGTVLDVEWIDGYFMTTDGEFLVVTALSDPTQVNPVKYGSSEANPDPINGLEKLNNEIYALNRYTIEVFDNVGGSGFPFARVESAQIEKGSVGTHASCKFLNTVAFLGGGKNESPAIWLAGNAIAQKISTREIDEYLNEFTESELSEVVVESRTDKNHEYLYIHLADKTLVYDANASQALQIPVWFILSSSNNETFTQYRARNFIWVYDKWYFGDPTTTKIGYLDESINTHFGETVQWEARTAILYNESKGALIHELELVALSNQSDSTNIYTSFSLDLDTFSPPLEIQAAPNKRLAWFQQGAMEDRRIQKFYGTTKISLARLEVQFEPLYV